MVRSDSHCILSFVALRFLVDDDDDDEDDVDEDVDEDDDELFCVSAPVKRTILASMSEQTADAG